MAINLVLGLGNPGEEYASTRHNIGFEVVEETVRRQGRSGWTHRADSDLCVVTPGRLVVVAKPLRFMNRSGEVAGSLLSSLNLPVESLLVVVDDVDLPLGDLRLRKSGGPGTHNGLRNICGEIGRGFARLRVGVQGRGRAEDLAEYVLSPFEPDERPIADAAVQQAADAIDCGLRQGFERAMNAFNGARRPAGAS